MDRFNTLILENYDLALKWKEAMEKQNEDEIQKYMSLYHWITKNLKKSPSYYEWKAFEELEPLVQTIDKLLVSDIKTLEQKLQDFTNQYFTATPFALHTQCAHWNQKIGLKSKLVQLTYNHISDNIQRSLAIWRDNLIDATQTKAEQNRLIINTYYSLSVVKKCLKETGLLLDRIAQRSDNQLFNFIVIDETGKRKKNTAHFLIAEDLLAQYVSCRNLGQEMYVKGIYVPYKKENSVIITATKLKNKEEIGLYKKRFGRMSDLEFAHSAIFNNITETKIPIQVPVIPINNVVNNEVSTLLQLVKDCLEKDNLRQAIQIVLDQGDIAADDKDDFILIKARLVDLERAKASGTSSQEEYNRERIKIRQAILSFANAINEI
jgi:hypothetical protein